MTNNPTSPSKDTELPAGMTHCTTAENAAPLDLDEAPLSCTAYVRTFLVLDLRNRVDRLHTEADELESIGMHGGAAAKRDLANTLQADHDAAVTAWTADPAPCTCSPRA